MPSNHLKKRVVIVGGGFGGLAVAHGLRREDVDITLLDRSNHHLFQPLLYQVATAALSPADIAEPIRRILSRQENVEVFLGSATKVDLDEQLVHWDNGILKYDYVVLAAGATHAYFGHDEWSERAPGLKTVDDALEIRRRILLAFEAAEMEDSPAARRGQLTFVVVGGGPTGVELAGALREIAVETIHRDFRHVDTLTARIILVEAQSRLLPGMSEQASARALEYLEEMGVEVMLGTVLTSLSSDCVSLQRGEEVEEIRARNVVWAAGVRASRLGKTLEVPLDQAGRVITNSDCSLPSHPNAFVIGDMASLTDPRTGTRVPGVAQGAIQMGRFVASTLVRDLRQEHSPRRVFQFVDKGNMATIGRAKAVVDIGDKFYDGLLAWLLWSFVHIAFLVSFRNRFSVMLGWAWNYVGGVRGARLITGGNKS